MPAKAFAPGTQIVGNSNNFEGQIVPKAPGEGTPSRKIVPPPPQEQAPLRACWYHGLRTGAGANQAGEGKRMTDEEVLAQKTRPVGRETVPDPGPTSFLEVDSARELPLRQPRRVRPAVRPGRGARRAHGRRLAGYSPVGLLGRLGLV